ncbi:DDE-type integrase/transposase/recombinase [Prolixibacteraceae bacterium]|nr:DDE-type integrase/transposase/recombinase [Prolixibacteraceae bacterium]
MSEKDVVASIKDILSHEFIDCGYHVMTEYLKREGYRINHKKVYRIMKNAGLIKASSRIIRGKGSRKFVQFRKVETSRPLEYIEMDIKLVWLPNVGKNAYLLSIIDLHTRKILGSRFARQMKQNAGIDLLGSIFTNYGTIDGMAIRSDNESQFLATDVRNYIEMMGVSQEFTHGATPEENAHIEAYHGTLKRDIFLIGSVN